MKLILFLLSILLLFQCQTTKSNFKDRTNDAGDIFSFSFDESIGFEINLIGLTGGIYTGQSSSGCYYSTCFLKSINEFSSTFLIFSSQQLIDKRDHHENYYFLRNKKYSIKKILLGKAPLTYYGRIKVRAGFFFGLSFEFNFLELADFALGFAGIDFLEDDYNQYIEELIQNRKRVRETGLKNSKLEKRK